MNLSLCCSRGEPSIDPLLSPDPNTTTAAVSGDNNPSSASYDGTRLATHLERDALRMGTIPEEEEGEDREGEAIEGDKDCDYRETGVCTVDGDGKLSLSMCDKMPGLGDTAVNKSSKSPNMPQQRLVPKPAVLIVGGARDSSVPSQISRRCSSHQSGVREVSRTASKAALNRATASEGASKGVHAKTARFTNPSCCNKHSSTISDSCSCSGTYVCITTTCIMLQSASEVQ